MWRVSAVTIAFKVHNKTNWTMYGIMHDGISSITYKRITATSVRLRRPNIAIASDNTLVTTMLIYVICRFD